MSKAAATSAAWAAKVVADTNAIQGNLANAVERYNKYAPASLSASLSARD